MNGIRRNNETELTGSDSKIIKSNSETKFMWSNPET